MSEHLPDLSTTRRTLLRTTAWSVPAVSLAAAAPAFAGSGPNLIGVGATGFWGGSTTPQVDMSGGVGAALLNMGSEPSPPAQLTIDLSAWPTGGSPLRLGIMSGLVESWSAEWSEPVLAPAPSPGLPEGLSFHFFGELPGGVLTLAHTGGIPVSGQSHGVLLWLFTPVELLTEGPQIPLQVSVSATGWGVDPDAPAVVSPMQDIRGVN